MADNAAITLRGVHKRFGDQHALRDVSIDIAAGSLTGLVGPDGAGKTTLMRLFAGLMSPSEGQVFVCGYNIVEQAKQVHKVTGYMPQRFGLYEDLTVMENLNLNAKLRALSGQQRTTIFERLLHFTRLETFTDRLAGQLSGGMKQKLGLACALMAQPPVLLLDEPSVGVDPVSRRELWAMVQDLVGDGMTVIWSTAYLDEAERCAQVLLLEQGQVLYEGAPDTLTDRLRGRSFLVRDIGHNRRRALTEALELAAVRDGVIQGEAVRLVTAEAGQEAQLAALLDRYQGRLESVPPRFEDAFIDLLGGGPGGHSAIAERTERIAASATGDSDTMVECEQLTKRFGEFTATDHVSFSVRRGEVLGLLGPNGAGKSTTFKMLCGLLRPSEGEARVAGMDLRRSPVKAKRQLGYMAQKFSLYGLLSVQQNLEFFSGAYGLAGRGRRQRVEEMVEVFDLGGLLTRSPDELPLGYKQRLALACALMHRPSVLFLDEPTSGVDPITRREFWTHITGLVEKGVTVLVTTHFMDEAEYCDRVALVNRSQLIALDTPDALKASVAGPETPNPTMEEAFIELVSRQDSQQRLANELRSETAA